MCIMLLNFIEYSSLNRLECKLLISILNPTEFTGYDSRYCDINPGGIHLLSILLSKYHKLMIHKIYYIKTQLICLILAPTQDFLLKNTKKFIYFWFVSYLEWGPWDTCPRAPWLIRLWIQ